MSRITVFGGSGYIGRHLTTFFQNSGYDVYVPERGNLEVFSSDLGQVVYAIGLTADFRSRPFETIEAHVIYLCRVLREAKFDSFLYLSSTRIYENSKSTDEDESITINSANPTDLYSISKLMGESLVLNCGRKNTRVARLSNVVGGVDPSHSFLESLVSEARLGIITLQSSLESQKDYIHIDDAVIMLEMVLSRGTKAIYNIAAGMQISNREWVEAIQKKFDCTLALPLLGPKITFPKITIKRFSDEFLFLPGSAIRFIDSLS